MSATATETTSAGANAASDISRVGVVGFGTMGAGIAQVCALAGMDVVVVEPSAPTREKSSAAMARHLARDVEKGRLSEQDRDAALERLDIVDTLEAVFDADLVIEAVPELIEVKKELFERLDTNCREDAVLATNTSSLSVTAVAAATKRPERVCGLHFFNPVPVLPLVEVVRGERTSPETFDRAFAFATAIGKTPIGCDDTPGFVVNRILIPLINDVVRLYENGLASAEDIDTGMRLGANWPIGPLALADLVGIDVLVHAAEGMYESLREPRYAPPALLTRMMEAGKLGRKTGEGFYSYDR